MRSGGGRFNRRMQCRAGGRRRDVTRRDDGVERKKDQVQCEGVAKIGAVPKPCGLRNTLRAQREQCYLDIKVLTPTLATAKNLVKSGTTLCRAGREKW